MIAGIGQTQFAEQGKAVRQNAVKTQCIAQAVAAVGVGFGVFPLKGQPGLNKGSVIQDIANLKVGKQAVSLQKFIDIAVIVADARPGEGSAQQKAVQHPLPVKADAVFLAVLPPGVPALAECGLQADFSLLKGMARAAGKKKLIVVKVVPLIFERVQADGAAQAEIPAEAQIMVECSAHAKPDAALFFFQRAAEQHAAESDALLFAA